MILRVLVDACLTPAGAGPLRRRFGTRLDIVHVNDVLPPAATDLQVLSHAKLDGRAVVTADIGDFGALARTIQEHAGIGLIGEQNGREQQIAGMIRLVDVLLLYVEGGGIVSGRIFRLRRTGRLAVRKWPP